MHQRTRGLASRRWIALTELRAAAGDWGRAIELAGAEDQETSVLVEQLAREDFLGQLIRRDGRAGELALESGRPQLDWVDGMEKALSRSDLLAAIEGEAAAALRGGFRHLIWSGMGGSVQTVHVLKRLGYLDAHGVSVHPLDSTDPAALNRILGEIAELEGIDLAAGGLPELLRNTLMISVAMVLPGQVCPGAAGAVLPPHARGQVQHRRTHERPRDQGISLAGSVGAGGLCPGS
jgi:hypothetical protein